MAKFRVVGARAIDSVAPGGVVEIKDDSGVNIGALLSAGHLELVDEDDFVDLDTLTVAELKAYAEREGIDLGGAKTKAELVDVISRAPADPITDGLGEKADGSDES